MERQVKEDESVSPYPEKLGNFQLSVDLEHPGGVTGLLGASGCGKSMTLKSIAGMKGRTKEGSCWTAGYFSTVRRKSI